MNETEVLVAERIAELESTLLTLRTELEEARKQSLIDIEGLREKVTRLEAENERLRAARHD